MVAQPPQCSACGGPVPPPVPPGDVRACGPKCEAVLARLAGEKRRAARRRAKAEQTQRWKLKRGE